MDELQVFSSPAENCGERIASRARVAAGIYLLVVFLALTMMNRPSLRLSLAVASAGQVIAWYGISERYAAAVGVRAGTAMDRASKVAVVIAMVKVAIALVDIGYPPRA